MYGTVARLQIKPGKEADFVRFGEEIRGKIPGLVFQHVYRSDSNPNEFYLSVGFESREAYQANAGSPEQAKLYEQYRALLTAEPEWHDGEIVASYPT